MLLDISFPIAFFSLSLAFSLPFNTYTHTQQPNRMEICEKILVLLLSFFRFFPQIEGSLSREFRKNSLHFRWLRFLHDLIFYCFLKANWHHYFTLWMLKAFISLFWHLCCKTGRLQQVKVLISYTRKGSQWPELNTRTFWRSTE